MSMTLGSMNTQYSPAPLPSCVLIAPAEGCVEEKTHLIIGLYTFFCQD